VTVGPASPPRSASFDAITYAVRAIRSVRADPLALVPPSIAPVIFYVVVIGSLSAAVGRRLGVDYEAFGLPLAVVFAVVGASRATMFVRDIETGYLSRLLTSPARRGPMLVGAAMVDFALAVALCTPVLGVSFAMGVHFESGVAGALVFPLAAGLWGISYAGFLYALALRSGSAAAVGASFILYYPLAFMTTAFVPLHTAPDWLAVVSTFNPVTYVLDGLRDLLFHSNVLIGAGKVMAAAAGTGAVSYGLAARALGARVRAQ
jgi:ABC-2 type transport system permease protein